MESRIVFSYLETLPQAITAHYGDQHRNTYYNHKDIEQRRIEEISVSPHNRKANGDSEHKKDDYRPIEQSPHPFDHEAIGIVSPRTILTGFLF
jgi:hypothetical protein